MFELKKIGIVKRASALLLDAILLMVLATGFMYIISLICRFEKHTKLLKQYTQEFNDDWKAFGEEYGRDLTEHYGFIYEENEDGFSVKTTDGKQASFEEEVIKKFVADKGEFDAENPDFDRMKAAYDSYTELYKPLSKANWEYQLIMRFLFLMGSFGFLLAYLVLEFVIPIILKNGQTVGKKVFGIGLVRPNCVKIQIMSLFARTLLGKYAIETMFPLLLVFMLFFGGWSWISIILFAAITLLNIILFFVTKNRTPIHDMLAGTVAVDIKLQMIYQSEEELAQKKSLAVQEESEKARW